MKIETCGICDVSICNHAWKLVEAGYLCGQDRNYTRIGNVFNVSIYLSNYLSIYLWLRGTQGGSFNKEVEWRQWFGGTQGGKFK